MGWPGTGSDRNWPRLVDWIQKTGEDLAFFRQLRRAADEWKAQDRRGDLRWPRRRWKQAEAVVERLKADLDEPVRSFLAAGRRRTRTQIASLGLALAVLILAGGLAVFTYTEADGNFKYAVDGLWERVRYALGVSDLREPAMVEIRPGAYAGRSRHPLPFPRPIRRSARLCNPRASSPAPTPRRCLRCDRVRRYLA